MTQEPGFTIGVDGGATRTRFVLVDGRGDVCARREGAEGSLLGAGEDEAVAELLVRGSEALLASAGGGFPAARFCAGLAGAGRPELRAALEARLRERGVASIMRITTDVEVARYHAFGAGPGVLLIAGTGSNALGRAADGTLHQVGGWGSLLGDEGSAFRIGIEGLRAAIRGLEGRGPATALPERLLRAEEVAVPSELLHWAEGAPKARVAALAPVVIAVADEGDAVAEGIVAGAVEDLVAHLRALEVRLGAGAPEVALVGGLVEPGRPLRARVVSALEKAGYPVRPGRVDGALGAARLVLEG